MFTQKLSWRRSKRSWMRWNRSRRSSRTEQELSRWPWPIQRRRNCCSGNQDGPGQQKKKLLFRYTGWSWPTQRRRNSCSGKQDGPGQHREEGTVVQVNRIFLASIERRRNCCSGNTGLVLPILRRRNCCSGTQAGPDVQREEGTVLFK